MPVETKFPARPGLEEGRRVFGLRMRELSSGMRRSAQCPDQHCLASVQVSAPKKILSAARAARRASAGAFGGQPFELVGLVIDIAHRFRDHAVPRAFGDRSMHCLCNAPVRRMALRGRPQLTQVHGLACVHVHDIPDPVRERYRVRGLVGELAREIIVQVSRALECVVEAGRDAGFAHRVRHFVAVAR